MHVDVKQLNISIITAVKFFSNIFILYLKKILNFILLHYPALSKETKGYANDICNSDIQCNSEFSCVNKVCTCLYDKWWNATSLECRKLIF